MRCTGKRGGYTLIELIVAIGISSILFSICVTVLIKSVKDNQTEIENNITLDNFDNCLINIDNLLHSSYITNITTINNKLIIDMLLAHETNSSRRKEIFLKGNRLVVQTISEDGADITTGENTLLKNVNDFKVTKKENLIYFTITTEKGFVRTRCI